MSKRILIGLVGKKRSGKNTFADFLYEEPGFCVQLAFGDELKQEVADCIGKNIWEIHEEKEKYRSLLQFWGTNLRRFFCGEDYWIKKVAARMATLDSSVMVVITDVRFPNEAKFIKDNGGVLVRIVRDGLPQDSHQSETEQEKIQCDYTVCNNHTLEDLKAAARILLGEIRRFNSLGGD